MRTILLSLRAGLAGALRPPANPVVLANARAVSTHPLPELNKLLQDVVGKKPLSPMARIQQISMAMARAADVLVQKERAEKQVVLERNETLQAIVQAKDAQMEAEDARATLNSEKEKAIWKAAIEKQKHLLLNHKANTRGLMEVCEETIFDSLDLPKGSRELTWAKAVKSEELNDFITCMAGRAKVEKAQIPATMKKIYATLFQWVHNKNDVELVQNGFKIEATYHVLPYRELLVLQCLGAAINVDVEIVEAEKPS